MKLNQLKNGRVIARFLVEVTKSGHIIIMTRRKSDKKLAKNIAECLIKLSVLAKQLVVYTKKHLCFLLQSNNFIFGEISETLQKVASICQLFLYCGAWVLRGIQGGACAPLTSGYLHQIRRYLASKYRACPNPFSEFCRKYL